MIIYAPIDNKYSSWYRKLVNKCRDRILENTYTEKHHILPKSLGGDNSPDNLVTFTLREHYVAHLLLSKMYEGDARRKMVYALWIMLLQEKMSESHSGEKNSMFGKKHSEITKLKIGAAGKERHK